MHPIFSHDEMNRPKLEGFADRTAHMPILNVFSLLMKDWIPLIDEYHYCKLRCFITSPAHLPLDLHKSL